MLIPGPSRRTPAAIAAALERGIRLPEGPGDRYAGYAVLDVRLASGEILALRRFPVTSVGTGYTSVWHRDANREWTLFSDVPKPHGCSRYFADMFTRSVVAPIRIDWRGPRSLPSTGPPGVARASTLARGHVVGRFPRACVHARATQPRASNGASGPVRGLLP